MAFENCAAEQKPEPAWKVFFTGNFWSHHGRDHAGKEIQLGAHLDWADRHWFIPAIYLCGKGLVVDLCMQVEVAQIRHIYEKWRRDVPDSDENTREKQMQMEAEDPFSMPFHASLSLNGKRMKKCRGCEVRYSPYMPDEMEADAKVLQAAAHYGLDASYGWRICRLAFPWTHQHRPELKSLSITLEQLPSRVPGPHFKLHTHGDSVSFVHPVSGETYTLTAEKLEPQDWQQMQNVDPQRSYPTHLIAMQYSITPEPGNELAICDCADSDQPVQIVPGNACQQMGAQDSASIGIIGGADGPTAILLSGDQHTVCSSLHFAPITEDVEWQVLFRVKKYENKTVVLL